MYSVLTGLSISVALLVLFSHSARERFYDALAYSFGFVVIKPLAAFRDRKGHRLPPSTYPMDSEAGEPVEYE